MVPSGTLQYYQASQCTIRKNLELQCKVALIGQFKGELNFLKSGLQMTQKRPQLQTSLFVDVVLILGFKKIFELYFVPVSKVVNLT